MIRALYRFLPASLIVPAFVFLTLSAARTGPVGVPANLPSAYDERAEATRDIAAALEQASARRKLVLLVFGANWCADCRAFEAEMTEPDFGSALAENYVVVKVDVGRFKKNLDVVAKYGATIRRGIPAAAIVSAEGRTLAIADGRRLAELRKAGQRDLVRFVDGAAVSAKTSAATRP
jgi:thioredoxin 1